MLHCECVGVHSTMTNENESGDRQTNQVFGAHVPSQMMGLPTSSEGVSEHARNDDLGFDIPVDTVPLPSRGKVYGETTQMHGITQVPIRAMTAREEDILTSRALLKNGSVITHLLRSCIVDKRVDPRELISGDRTALMVALRITGYGPEYKIETECPKCEHKQHVDFDLSELPVKWLDLEPDTERSNAFTVTLPVSKKRVTFRFLTGADEEEIQQEQVLKKKKLKTQLDTLVTTRFQRQIIGVDGRSEQGFISKFIRTMPVRDSHFLRKYIADNEPGMEMEAVMVCEDCQEASEVDVPIQASFFWPE